MKPLKIGLLLLSGLVIIAGVYLYFWRLAKKKTVKIVPPPAVVKIPEVKKIFPSEITRGNTSEKKVVLTFDGGSEANAAEDILKTLREKRIKTTIFLTGEFIKRYPEIVRQMVTDGHEVGNHTFTHPRLTTYAKNFKQKTLPNVNKEVLRKEFEETAKLFKETTGKEMAPFWRAPYGEINEEIRQWAYELGYSHVGWTMEKKENLDSLDWVADTKSRHYLDSERIKERILQFGKQNGKGLNGGIILMHLGTQRKKDSVHKKLPELIDELKSSGYEMVKVSELTLSRP